MMMFIPVSCRTIPIALRDRVKQELNRMVSTGVIEPVNKPTEWVSQMAIVKKANGSLRICIDPQPLLTKLFRNSQMPKIFSPLDVQSTFWHVKLNEASSNLTTMTTPFGRYCWKRLPLD